MKNIDRALVENLSKLGFSTGSLDVQDGQLGEWMLMKEAIRTGGKIALSLNVAMVLLLFVLFVGNKSANFSFLGILALLPAISILTFAMEVPGRTLLVLCWVGNSVASVLGALAALMFFLMVSRAATFGMVVIFFLFYFLVAVSSALAAFKLWKRKREGTLA